MPPEKSCSARISRATALSLTFFIIFSLSSACAPGADDADIIAPFRMHDNQQFPLVGLSQNDATVLHLRMGRVCSITISFARGCDGYEAETLTWQRHLETRAKHSQRIACRGRICQSLSHECCYLRTESFKLGNEC